LVSFFFDTIQWLFKVPKSMDLSYNSFEVTFSTKSIAWVEAPSALPLIPPQRTRTVMYLRLCLRTRTPPYIDTSKTSRMYVRSLLGFQCQRARTRTCRARNAALDAY
ncbi:hypothetical protein V8E53_015672, partial [Lactarius tabidus]